MFQEIFETFIKYSIGRNIFEYFKYFRGLKHFLNISWNIWNISIFQIFDLPCRLVQINYEVRLPCNNFQDYWDKVNPTDLIDWKLQIDNR